MKSHAAGRAAVPLRRRKGNHALDAFFERANPKNAAGKAARRRTKASVQIEVIERVVDWNASLCLDHDDSLS